MLNFKEFSLIEEETIKTKIEQTKLNISKNFDLIKDSKELVNNGKDLNTEIAELKKQAGYYSEISKNMITLSQQMAILSTSGEEKENI